jgi:glycosyltransferase involved in cell wall biosynthesis
MKTGILFILEDVQSLRFGNAFGRIINGLSTEKYEVFMACQKGMEPDPAVSARVKYLPMDFSRRLNPLLILRLKRFIERNNISIVHGLGTKADLHGGLAAGLAGKVKYISTLESVADEIEGDDSLKKKPDFLERLSYQFVHTYIAPSDVFMRKAVSERRIASDKVVRIYNGMELNKPSSAEARNHIRVDLNINDNTVLIGAFGSLVWQNGFEFLIKSMPIFIRSHPNSKVLISGDGPFKKNLKMHSELINVADHLILPESRNDKQEMLSAIDILVVPSLVEDFPMIIFEGMAMARPIIATRTDGSQELIEDGETGIIVPSWDANSIARAINRLIDDSVLAKNMGLKARQKAERDFSIEKMVVEIEQIYGQI